MPVTCFWVEPVGRAQVGLRRYTPSQDTCPRLGAGRMTYHDAMFPLPDEPPYPRVHGDDWREHYDTPDYAFPDHDDPRWPEVCACGYEFTSGDRWQDWTQALYQRPETGAVFTLRDAPDGAMWDAWWLPGSSQRAADGRCPVVKCPGGAEWVIDGRASNCTLPNDTEHRCWIRHGEPPRLTVDKNGLTCNAGAGSIQAGNYHGFLRDGAFT